MKDQCNSTDSFSYDINVYELPKIEFQANVISGCEPLTIRFNNMGSINYYLWDFGDNESNISQTLNPTHTYQNSGIFDVTLSCIDSNNCRNSLTLYNYITVYDTPHASFRWEPTNISVINTEVNFINLSTDATTYMWNFLDDESNHVDPVHNFPEETGYYTISLIASTDNGCRDTIQNEIFINDEYTFYAPTAFTPNNNSRNDYFRVYGNGIGDIFDLYVFDRWGEIIFHSKSIDDFWYGDTNRDGYMAPIGTYAWKCVYELKYGTQRTKAGYVTLIR